MADTIDITAGAGTTVATDDVGGVHYQEIKLIDGTKDSSTPIAVDVGAKANALRVAPANDITDGTYIGDIKFGEAEPNSAAILADTTAILADTAAIQTAVELLDNAVDGNYLNVNNNIAGTDIVGGAGAVAAGVQRVTLASDDPAVVDLAAIEVLLGTIDTDTGNIATSLGNIDNAVDGNYLNVNMNLAGTDAQAGEGVITASTQRVTLATDDDGVAHLATIAGDTTSIDGKITACNTGAVVLAASDGTDIGNVDVASIAAGTNVIGKVRLVDDGGTEVTENTDHSVNVTIVADDVGIGGGTQYTEDAVAAADPVGNALIMVREDSPVSVAADGDNVAQRCTEYGAGFVQILDSSGNFIDSFGGSGGTAAADDADFTAGTTQGTPAMGVYESSPTSVTDGDLGTVGITQTRSLKVQETNSGTATSYLANIATSAGLIDNAIYVDDADWTDNTSSHILTGGIYQSSPQTITDGDTGPIQVDSNGNIIESNSAAILADTANMDTNLATIAGDTTSMDALLTTIDADTSAINTNMANLTLCSYVDDGDWTDSTSRHLLVGGLYQTAPQTITNGDVGPFQCDSYGKILVGTEYTKWQAVYNSSDATGEGEVVKASAASTILVVTGFIISADIEGWVKLQDEDSTALTGKFWFKAGGGTAWTLPSNTPIVLTSNKDLEVIAEAAGDVSVTAVGYTIAG
jgi:hypothetical protein